MNNQEFLNVISNSFKVFLKTGSRSDKKLKVLHGAIASDLSLRLGTEFDVVSLGIGEGKEAKIRGRYIDKKVDIAICRNAMPIAGIGVKFVMQNYSQNSNNYFENMLGETANIRCAKIPYFQIFIIPEKLPYYDRNFNFKKWEEFSVHNSAKYLALSEDNIDSYLHTPTKTLLAVVRLPCLTKNPKTKREYVSAYSSQEKLEIKFSKTRFGAFSQSVVFNDYETFAQKLVSYIKFL